MRDLAENFLDSQDREKIRKAVTEAEKETSGEIVPMVVSRSYHYPMADVIGGFVFAFPLSLIAAYFIGSWLWIGSYNLGLFLGIITIFFFLFRLIIQRIPGLKRVFISEKEILEEVEEEAITSFFREGLYHTRDQTGVLIFISVFERRVWVIADRGINERVEQDQWDKIVKMIVEGIKKGKQAEAACEAVQETGRILKQHFPIRKDDTDELKNLIIK